jgi:hypothetical protein
MVWAIASPCWYSSSLYQPRRFDEVTMHVARQRDRAAEAQRAKPEEVEEESPQRPL